MSLSRLYQASSIKEKAQFCLPGLNSKTTTHVMSFLSIPDRVQFGMSSTLIQSRSVKSLSLAVGEEIEKFLTQLIANKDVDTQAQISLWQIRSDLYKRKKPSEFQEFNDPAILKAYVIAIRSSIINALEKCNERSDFSAVSFPEFSGILPPKFFNNIFKVAKLWNVQFQGFFKDSETYFEVVSELISYREFKRAYLLLPLVIDDDLYQKSLELLARGLAQEKKFSFAYHVTKKIADFDRVGRVQIVITRSLIDSGLMISATRVASAIALPKSQIEALDAVIARFIELNQLKEALVAASAISDDDIQKMKTAEIYLKFGNAHKALQTTATIGNKDLKDKTFEGFVRARRLVNS
jgi:hypothetical protein